MAGPEELSKELKCMILVEEKVKVNNNNKSVLEIIDTSLSAMIINYLIVSTPRTKLNIYVYTLFTSLETVNVHIYTLFTCLVIVNIDNLPMSSEEDTN